LKFRVIAILDSRIRRKRMSKLAIAALVFGTAALTIGVGVVRVTALEATPLPARLMPAPVQEPSPGYVVNRSPLSYPVEAIQKRIEGSVVVELTFNDLGKITGSRILSGPDELRQAALQTALQGKYAINIARSLQVIVDFKLPAAGTGEISGTSADPSGVPAPGAKITATNGETGTVTSVVTNQTGAYRFPDLPAGTYHMRAELPGFRSNTFDNVKLGNQQQVRLNFALREEGGFSTEIVSALPPQVDPPVRPLGFFTVVESVDIRGLQEPLLTEMRQKFESLPGQLITSDLLKQVRATIMASSWGQKPVGFMVNPRTANGSDLLITFYEPSASSARVRIGGNVLAANLVNQVKPIYPQEAKDKRIQGVVVLEIDVGMDGRVTGTWVITGHPLLVQAAIEAVSQWVYKPIIFDGQPVVAVSTVTLNFAFQQ
jgi:TonB family protein